MSENFRKFKAKIWKNVILELYKGVHCVDLGESFPTHIYLQNLASIQPRTSPLKFVGSRNSWGLHPGGLHFPSAARGPPTRARRSRSRRRRPRGPAPPTRARSRLYQNEILQQNMRLTAFSKLWKICILLHRCNLKIFAKKSVWKISKFCENSAKVLQMSQN